MTWLPGEGDCEDDEVLERASVDPPFLAVDEEVDARV